MLDQQIFLPIVLLHCIHLCLILFGWDQLFLFRQAKLCILPLSSSWLFSVLWNTMYPDLSLLCSQLCGFLHCLSTRVWDCGLCHLYQLFPKQDNLILVPFLPNSSCQYLIYCLHRHTNANKLCHMLKLFCKRRNQFQKLLWCVYCCSSRDISLR